MICLLLGLVPPCLEHVDQLRAQLAHVPNDDGDDDDDNDDVNASSSHPIRWIESCTAQDTDQDGTETLLVSAWTTASPEKVCEAVQVTLTTLKSCEVWATAPAPLPLQPPQGYNLQYNMNNNAEAAAQTMQDWGLLLQPNVLDSTAMVLIRQIVDNAIQQTETTLAALHPHLHIGQDELLFQEIASRNKQRFDLKLQNEQTMDFVLKKILQANQPSIQALLKATLGDDLDFDVSVVYSKPGACTQHWHADGAHRENDAGWEKTSQHLAPPYAICLFIPLIDLNESVGYTQFWPGSHRHKQLVGFGPVAALTGSTLDTKVKAGDGIWYDYRLLHRGMPNKSTNTTRHILQIVWKKKWYIEKANYGVKSIQEKNK